MKPLNRPMFKYGGPIKEGIMSGMKDNTGTGLVGDKDILKQMVDHITLQFFLL